MEGKGEGKEKQHKDNHREGGKEKRGVEEGVGVLEQTTMDEIN